MIKDGAFIPPEGEKRIWEWTASTPTSIKPRYYHTASTIGTDHDSKTVIFGGSGDRGSLINEVNVWNKRNGKWSNVTWPTGCSGRYSHAAVSVKDVVYIYGGCTGTSLLNDMYILDTSSWRWRTSSSSSNPYMPSPRRGHVMTQHEGRIFLYGGITLSTAPDTTLYALDPREGNWVRVRTRGDTPSTLDGGSMSLIHDNYLLMCGGLNPEGMSSSMHTFNLKTGVWEPYLINGQHLLGKGLCYHTTTSIDEGKGVVFFGGWTPDSSPTNSLLYLDLETRTLTKQHALGLSPLGRHGHAAQAFSTEAGGYEIYFFAGRTSERRVSDICTLNITRKSMKTSSVNKKRSPPATQDMNAVEEHSLSDSVISLCMSSKPLHLETLQRYDITQLELLEVNLEEALKTVRNVKYEKLKEAKEQSEEKDKCRICWDKKKNVTFLPCGHFACCETYVAYAGNQLLPTLGLMRRDIRVYQLYEQSVNSFTHIKGK